jgi:hypothetical protein
MLIYVIEVEGKDGVADEPRKPTGRMWIASEDFIMNHFQPDKMVYAIYAHGEVHITRTIADELGIGSEPSVEILL